jgi:hypothetical protein
MLFPKCVIAGKQGNVIRECSKIKALKREY